VRFTADVVETSGARYQVTNGPIDVVRWESQSPRNNVEGLKRFSNIMAVIHQAAIRQGFTEVKVFNEWAAGLEAFDLVADETEAGPTSEGRPGD